MAGGVNELVLLSAAGQAMGCIIRILMPENEMRAQTSGTGSSTSDKTASHTNPDPDSRALLFETLHALSAAGTPLNTPSSSPTAAVLSFCQQRHPTRDLLLLLCLWPRPHPLLRPLSLS